MALDNRDILLNIIFYFALNMKTHVIGTLQPPYNMVRYNMVLDITRFKDGSQKCIDYIEK